jgi:hypothetical protein
MKQVNCKRKRSNCLRKANVPKHVKEMHMSILGFLDKSTAKFPSTNTSSNQYPSDFIGSSNNLEPKSKIERRPLQPTHKSKMWTHKNHNKYGMMLDKGINDIVYNAKPLCDTIKTCNPRSGNSDTYHKDLSCNFLIRNSTGIPQADNNVSSKTNMVKSIKPYKCASKSPYLRFLGFPNNLKSCVGPISFRLDRLIEIPEPLMIQKYHPDNIKRVSSYAIKAISHIINQTGTLEVQSTFTFLKNIANLVIRNTKLHCQRLFLKKCMECNIYPNFVVNTINWDSPGLTEMNEASIRNIKKTCKEILNNSILNKSNELKSTNLEIKKLLLENLELEKPFRLVLENLRFVVCSITWKKHVGKFRGILNRIKIHECVNSTQFKINKREEGGELKKLYNQCNENHYDVYPHRYFPKEFNYNKIKYIEKDNNVINNNITSIEQVKIFLNKCSSNYSIPPINQKFEDEVELGCNRAIYGYRWSENIKSNIEDPETINNVPYETKNPRFPPLANRIVEGNLDNLKSKIINIVKDEKKIDTTNWKNINKICKENNLLIVPTDKTKKNVLIDIDTYNRLGENFLKSKDYKKLNRSNCQRLSKRANKLLDNIQGSLKIKKHLFNRLKVNAQHGAKFFLSIKDHKNKDTDGNYPVRPIASVHGTAVDSIDFLLQKILGQCLEHIPTHLSNGTTLIKTVDELNSASMGRLNKNDYKIISLDVVNLYPSIPLKEGIDMVLGMIHSLKDKINLYGLSLEQIYELLIFVCYNYEIVFNNKNYLQLRGVPMGARFAPPFAIITMHAIETEAISKLCQNDMPLIYTRYIDDIFFLCSKDIDDVAQNERILKTFNSINKNIQFTLEKGRTEENEIPFLDMEFFFGESGIDYRWYMKDLHSGNLMNYHSHGPMKSKKEFAIGRFRCAIERSSNKTEKETAIKKITKLLTNNEYPLIFIAKSLKDTIDRMTNTTTTRDKLKFSKGGMPIKVPFISDRANNKIKTAIKNSELELQLVNTKNTNIQSLGTKQGAQKCMKCTLCDKLPETLNCRTQNIVYSYKCNKCPEDTSYIGKTNNTIRDRHRNHRKCFKDKDIKGSAMAEHMFKKHNMDNVCFDDAFEFNMLSKVNSNINTNLKEGNLINKLKPKLNRKCEIPEYNTF